MAPGYDELRELDRAGEDHQQCDVTHEAAGIAESQRKPRDGEDREMLEIVREPRHRPQRRA